MLKKLIKVCGMLLGIAVGVSLFGVVKASAADFVRTFVSTADVAGGMAAVKCSSIGANNGTGIVAIDGVVQRWAYDNTAVDAADSTHIRCNGYTSGGVWEFIPLDIGEATGTSLTLSGGTGNGGTVIDPLPDTDLTCEATESISVTVDTSGGFGYIVTNYVDFNFDTASATDDTKPPFGIMCEASTGVKLVMTIGFIRDDTWNWSVGWLYLATDGQLTQTAPSASGNVQYIVGRAISADVAYFRSNFGGVEQ